MKQIEKEGNNKAEAWCPSGGGDPGTALCSGVTLRDVWDLAEVILVALGVTDTGDQA